MAKAKSLGVVPCNLDSTHYQEVFPTATGKVYFNCDLCKSKQFINGDDGMKHAIRLMKQTRAEIDAEVSHAA